MTAPLIVLTSPLLDLPGIRHGFFTRVGGVSRGIYEGLNVGLGSADDPIHVMENRARAAAHFGLSLEALATGYQIHSTVALTICAPMAEPRAKADALVTNTAGLLCGALAADCAPILIADADAGVVAAVHAGWRGALDGVIGEAVLGMSALGAKPARMTAAVGPCIGPKSYEVGLEFRERFVADDPDYGRFFEDAAAADKMMFDLPAFALSRLHASGVEACEWIGADTCNDEAHFFSNRRAFKRGEPDFGRLLSAIVRS